jgi:transcriptional regulator GlxA family with amidase domain
MSRARRYFVSIAASLALPILVGAAGLRELITRERPGLPPAIQVPAARPALDPHRPTVVVLLGADLTEITDTLGPYEMFARVGTFNVVTAAPTRTPTLLTGGLRVVPHYSFAELDEHLGNRAAQVVVVPNIPNIAAPYNAPVVAWLQRQAARGALVHSWCTGAMTLAHAGLLDGLTATAHWGDLSRLEKAYPRVRWIRGVRWIDHGAIVMSAGLTSGIDASLHVIARLTDEETARRIARELRYPNYHFAIDPTVEPYAFRPADAIHLVNAAFRTGRDRIGVALYPGMSELDLSNVYDTHAFTTVADLEGIALDAGAVVTAHGLTLLPSRTADEVARLALDRLVVTGVEARVLAAPLLERLAAVSPALERTYLHADAPARFGLEPVLEDLARTADVATARFALRRLEYRSDSIRLEGSAVPWRTLAFPFLLGAIGLAIATILGRAVRAARDPLDRTGSAAHVALPMLSHRLHSEA